MYGLIRGFCDQRLHKRALLFLGTLTKIFDCSLQDLATFNPLILRIGNVIEFDLIPPLESLAPMSVSDGI